MASIDSSSTPRPTGRGRRLAGFALAAASALVFAVVLLAAVKDSPPVSPKVSTGLDWHTDLDSAQAAALSGDKKILVNLYASWCGWCRKLDQTVFSSDEFHRYSENFVLLKLDIEKDEDGARVQSRYRTSGVPVTLVLTPELDKVLAISGFMPLDRFLERVDTAVDSSEEASAAPAGVTARLAAPPREGQPWS